MGYTSNGIYNHGSPSTEDFVSFKQILQRDNTFLDLIKIGILIVNQFMLIIFKLCKFNTSVKTLE